MQLLKLRLDTNIEQLQHFVVSNKMSERSNTGIGVWLFCLFCLLLLFLFKANIASDIREYAGFAFILFGALGLTLFAFSGRKKK